MAGCSFCLSVWFSARHFLFGIRRNLVDFGRTATHLLSTTSHLRESLPGKDHFTSLISFRGWFTEQRTSLTHRSGISSSWYGRECRVSSLRAYFAFGWQSGRLNREAPYQFVFWSCFSCASSSLRNSCRSLDDYHLLFLRVLDLALALFFVGL